MGFLWSALVKRAKQLLLAKFLTRMEPVMKRIFNYIADKVVTLIGKVEWKQTHEIDGKAKQIIHNLLVNDYYIIATRRGNHLSTFFIGLSNFVLRGKWGYYSHVLMNLEDEVHDPNDFRLIEATGIGVNYNSFEKVFSGVDAVALLKPKHMTIQEWTEMMDGAKSELGKPYDTLFDLSNDNALSCVELIRAGLKKLPDYDTKFAHFEDMINKSKNLTPQMFIECDDFEVVFETRG